LDFVAGFTFGSVRCGLLLSGDGEKNGGGYWKNSKAGFFFLFSIGVVGKNGGEAERKFCGGNFLTLGLK